MEETKRPRLFVSHHSSKFDVALHVEKALARHGVDCWIAPRDVGPGEAFDSAILAAIRDSAGVLLLFCSQSDKSPHVKRELILADSAHKAIIPLRLEEIVPNDLAYHLASAQWIDWLEKRDDSIARIAAKAHQLAGTTIQTPAPAKTTDALHAAILSQATEPPAAKPPASVSVRTLLIAALLVTVGVLAAMLFMRGDGEPKKAITASNDVPAAAPKEAGDSMTAAPAANAPVTAAPPVEQTDPAPIRAAIPPTFNCRYASTNAEKAICASDELAALDRDMARAYRQLVAVAVARRDFLANEQSRWRLSVRDACPDDACIANVMRQRIDVLDERRSELVENRAGIEPAAE